MPDTFLRSPLKYPGGKRRLLTEIISRLPQGSFPLAETHAGGLSLSLALAGQGRLSRALAGEACAPVRAFWQFLTKHMHSATSFVASFDVVVQQFRDDPPGAFEWARNCLNRHANDHALNYEQAIFFYALNHTCMNGLVRFNSAGEFNAPIGRADGRFHRFEPDYELLARCAAALRGAKFEIRPSYKDAIREAGAGWGVYCDPPYTGGFVAYTPEGWSSDDDIELFTLCAKAGLRGARVVISQPDTPWARDCAAAILPGWQIDAIGVARPINSDGGGRGPVGELLIWNAPGEPV